MSTKAGIEVDVSEFDGDESLPIDTPAGIMQRISKTNAKARAEGGRRVQCPSTFVTGKRSMNISFCTLDEGHEGDHKGFRKKWANAKDRSSHAKDGK